MKNCALVLGYDYFNFILLLLTATICFQIDRAHQLDADFVSTMHTSPALIRRANLLQLPIMSGAQSVNDCFSSLVADSKYCAGEDSVFGADALKIFPAHKVPAGTLRSFLGDLAASQLLYNVREDEKLANMKTSDGILPPTIVSGGLKPLHFGEYVAAGATNVAIGIDVRKYTSNEIIDILEEADQAMYNVLSQHKSSSRSKTNANRHYFRDRVGSHALECN